jgi:hypothetical protein
MLSQAVNTALRHYVEGATVEEALDCLFRAAPGLENHIVDETGGIRPHVSVFVDGNQAGLSTPVGRDADIRVLHAVSGG